MRLCDYTSGGYAVTEVRTAAAHSARGVDNARVVRAGRERRTQPSVTRRTRRVAFDTLGRRQTVIIFELRTVLVTLAVPIPENFGAGE